MIVDMAEIWKQQGWSQKAWKHEELELQIKRIKMYAHRMLETTGGDFDKAFELAVHSGVELMMSILGKVIRNTKVEL